MFFFTRANSMAEFLPKPKKSICRVETIHPSLLLSSLFQAAFSCTTAQHVDIIFPPYDEQFGIIQSNIAIRVPHLLIPTIKMRKAHKRRSYDYHSYIIVVIFVPKKVNSTIQSHIKMIYTTISDQDIDYISYIDLMGYLIETEQRWIQRVVNRFNPENLAIGSSHVWVHTSTRRYSRYFWTRL